jgi:hypothetical protein
MLAETAQSNGKNPLAYRTDVLGRIGSHPSAQMDGLLPQNWKPPEAPAGSQSSGVTPGGTGAPERYVPDRTVTLHESATRKLSTSMGEGRPGLRRYAKPAGTLASSETALGFILDENGVQPRLAFEQP